MGNGRDPQKVFVEQSEEKRTLEKIIVAGNVV
jgi:hypothetical protein